MTRRRYIGDPRTASQIIAEERQAGTRRVFPAEFLDWTYDQIVAAARGNKAARRAKKLLDRREYGKR